MTVDKIELTLAEGEYEVGSLSDVEESDRFITEIEGREIAIFHEDDEYFAVANYCPHQAGPLCEGPLTGQITVGDDMNWQFSEDEKLVTCPWHYWKFDIETGESAKDGHYKVPTYDVEIRDDSIVVKT
jgi:nitrite reductase/ring-hydroxylating ferredoxin subunit